MASTQGFAGDPLADVSGCSKQRYFHGILQVRHHLSSISSPLSLS
jgi:hypothetical protein